MLNLVLVLVTIVVEQLLSIQVLYKTVVFDKVVLLD